VSWKNLTTVESSPASSQHFWVVQLDLLFHERNEGAGGHFPIGPFFDRSRNSLDFEAEVFEDDVGVRQFGTHWTMANVMLSSALQCVRSN
jgi:hypothetical protein